MSDYRIQKQIQAASKNLQEVADTIFTTNKTVDRTFLKIELMTKFSIMPKTADDLIMLIFNEKRFTLDNDIFYPKKE